MKKIKVLKLSDTKSGTFETEELFAALSRYQHLSELKLNNFTINQQAAVSLAEVINNNMFLKKLDIGWNTMTHSEDFQKML
jgi:Ran GTPase-activating protein (RanGAP) involved in mRNA processing and transport